jgi:DNA-binding GntR family transcriptional regulator
VTEGYLDIDIEEFQNAVVYSAPQTAARVLRDAILKGRLQPGDRLVEQKLAGRLGIGQPTLREALKELEHQGFVRKVPHKGTYVTNLSKGDYRKILDVRIILEAFAVRLAAMNLDHTTESDLANLLKRMEALVADSDLGKFHEVVIAFHRKIWALTHNQFLMKALEVTASQLFAFALLELGSGLNKNRPAAIQHRKVILDGLRSRDSERAREVFINSTVKYWNTHYHFDLNADDYNRPTRLSPIPGE